MDTTSPPTQRKATVACAHVGDSTAWTWRAPPTGPNAASAAGPSPRPAAGADRPSFDRVIADAQVPVLVDFYADWCGPCKMVAPIMVELARSRMGWVLVAKLDTDRNQQVAQRFGISSIPTVMVFRGGKIAAKQAAPYRAPATRRCWRRR